MRIVCVPRSCLLLLLDYVQGAHRALSARCANSKLFFDPFPLMFQTENARMLSAFYLNLMFSPLPQWWVVFRVVTGKQIYHWALGPRCVRAVQKRPPQCLSFHIDQLSH